MEVSGMFRVLFLIGASPSVLGRDDKIQSQLAEPRKIPLLVEPRP
jgi:hypothetical protein